MTATTHISRQHLQRPVAAAFSGNPFDKYRREKPVEVRKADIANDPVLAQLRRLWHRCYYKHKGLGYYELATKIIRAEAMKYSADDVARFCIALGEFQHKEEFSIKVGLVLSALINNGQDSDYRINIKHFGVRIFNLGHCNTKNIIIDGDGCSVGTGEFMEGGSIIINGDVETGVGHGLKNGRITVNGNVGDQIGLYLAGGAITINGNAKGSIGPH